MRHAACIRHDVWIGRSLRFVSFHFSNAHACTCSCSNNSVQSTTTTTTTTNNNNNNNKTNKWHHLALLQCTYVWELVLMLMLMLIFLPCLVLCLFCFVCSLLPDGVPDRVRRLRGFGGRGSRRGGCREGSQVCLSQQFAEPNADPTNNTTTTKSRSVDRSALHCTALHFIPTNYGLDRVGG